MFLVYLVIGALQMFSDDDDDDDGKIEWEGVYVLVVRQHGSHSIKQSYNGCSSWPSRPESELIFKTEPSRWLLECRKMYLRTITLFQRPRKDRRDWDWPEVASFALADNLGVMAATTRFLTSLGWSSYVALKPPKGAEKRSVQNLNNKLRWLRNGMR